MPDVSDLYPKPPQPGTNALASDPLKMIGTIGEIQRIGILGQQAPALVQQPAAALRGTNIANDTAQLQQNAAQMKIIAGHISGLDPNASPDDVHNLTTALSRVYPNIPANTINTVARVALDDPMGLKHGLATLRTLGLSPGEQSSRETGPPDATGAPTTIPKATANYAGTVTTGLPVGSNISAEAMQGDLRRSGSYASDIYPLNQALELAKKLGPGGMAPGSKGRQDFESFVYGLAPSILPEGMRDKIKNYAELEKYLVNNASQRAASLGPHTNDGLAAATSGSPNVHINDLAGVELIKAQIAIRRMEHAQTLEAAKAGPAQYNSAKARFSAGQDPRAYAIDMMSPEQIKNLQTSLKGKDRARFNASLKAAIESGVIVPPGQPQ